MSITNQDKPQSGRPETYLNIGGGFRLLVGSTFKLIAGALGTGGMTNSTKASIGTTWNTWTTAWDDETRTWDELSQLIENAGKTAYGAPLWNAQLVWQLGAPWQVDSAIMTNQSKP